MLPSHQHSRINLTELKAQMVKKLGPEGSKQYFYYLNRFLNSKLSKVEFSKLCLRILGRENIPLHNQLIRSILKNACTAKTPPPASHKDDGLKHGSQVGVKETSADGYQLNGVRSGATHASSSPGLSNGGDILPVSPRKARSGVRDRRIGDRRSALGPNGKTTVDPHLSKANQSSDFNVALENGKLGPDEIGRPTQHHQGLILPHDSDPLYRMGKPELVVKNDEKEASAKSPVRAPLGVPFCPASVGGARRALPPASSNVGRSAYNDGSLLDSRTLRERMEQIAVAQGLEGVSMDCANVLNNGLDLYIKRLISSCIELLGNRSGHESIKNNPQKHLAFMKPINGVRPGHQYHIPNNGTLLEVQEQRIDCPISLQDFRVAMELNPRQLGEDWPLLLEKISIRSFEE